MRNIEILNGSNLTAGQATELILDGCRNNPRRWPKDVADGHRVSFVSLIDGQHQAILRSDSWVPVAMATVDEADC